MATLINPSSARLGVTHFWIVNNPVTLAGNYPILENYRLQSYLYSLYSYCDWVFIEKNKHYFFLQLFLIFDNISFNQKGFPGNKSKTWAKVTLSISFFDFYLHVMNIEKHWKIVRRVMGYMKNVVMEYKYFKLDKTKETDFMPFFEFLFDFTKALTSMRVFLRLFYRNFFKTLRRLQFLKAFVRIHRYFFFNMPIRCQFQIKPYANRVNAQFLAIYLERKLRTGTKINYAMKLLNKYLRKNKHVKGYRIVISGRFKRGKKKGYISRTTGIYSYNRYNKNHLLDYGTSCADLKTGLCGIKVWLCTMPQKI